MEVSYLRWSGAVSGGVERSQMEGSGQVEVSGLRWRGAISGGGERSQVERSDRWLRGAVYEGSVHWWS